MKTIQFIVIVFLGLTTVSLSAQDEMKEVEEKMQYLTRTLDIQSYQIAPFQELYLKYNREKIDKSKKAAKRNEMLMEQLMEENGIEKIEDRDARGILGKYLEEKEANLKMESEYLVQLMEVIGAKKVLELQYLEKKFENRKGSKKDNSDIEKAEQKQQENERGRPIGR